MKFLFDLFPILLFFVAYKFAGIFVATAVAIAASVLQVLWFWWRHRRVEMMHMVTLVLIVVLGGATLWLHDEMFIKWKPTIVYWLFGAMFLASHYVGNKPLTARMMGATLNLPEHIWKRLNMGWALFFAALGAVNLYVVYHFDTNTWVNFKLFGLMGLMLLFIVVQAVYLSRHLTEQEPENKNP